MHQEAQELLILIRHRTGNNARMKKPRLGYVHNVITTVISYISVTQVTIMCTCCCCADNSRSGKQASGDEEGVVPVRRLVEEMRGSAGPRARVNDVI